MLPRVTLKVFSMLLINKNIFQTIPTGKKKKEKKKGTQD
jgi:hypothetical protein